MLSVVIPARDAEATMPALFAALAAQRDAPAHELIVVDDGSRDATRALAEAAGARVVAGTARGPAAARNAGAAAARGDVLCFTDADCAPEPGWMAAVAAAVGEGADIVQGRVLPPPGASIGPWDRFIWVAVEHGLYETANLSLRRAAFERLGGFETVVAPRSGIELGEDAWLGWRARRAGLRVVFEPRALVHHAVFARSFAGWLAERERMRHFPALVRRMPELRTAFLTHRVFLSPRTLRADAALAGVAAAALTRRRWPLLLAAPLAAAALQDARRWSPAVAAGRLLGDVAGCAALVYGSVAARTPVL